MSDRIQIEPVIGWPAYCDEIMSSLSLAQLEVSNLKLEISDLQDEISALRSGSYLASVVEERDRLRKALEGLLAAHDIRSVRGDLLADVIASATKRARAALEAKP